MVASEIIVAAVVVVPQTTGMSKAEICIHTRQAASSVGATTMDRPEWVAAMLAAWLLMVAGWIRMIRFTQRHKQPEQSHLNPVDGLRLWHRFLTPGGYGAEAEPVRASIVRMFLGALGCFALAVILFLVLPVTEG